MRVKGYGPVFGSSGYSVHTRNFFEALSNYCDLGLIPELENVFGTKLSDRAKLLLANGRLMQRRDIAINISHGNRMQSFCGEPMIGYTVFESSRIPNSWVHQLLELDYIWTVSEFAKKVLSDQGIHKDKIKIVPEGFNPDLFNFEVKPIKEERDFFRFLFVGKPEKRKAVLETIQAFKLAFDEKEAVKFIIYFPEFAISHRCEPYMDKIKAEIKERPNQLILELNNMSTRFLARYMKGFDAYVTGARSEGWGLPLMEALALGLPAIAYSYHGQAEFFKEGMGVVLKADEFEQIEDPVFFSDTQELGTWIKPNPEKIASAFKEIYHNREFYAQKKQQISSHMQENWTWDHAAKKAFNILEAL